MLQLTGTYDDDGGWNSRLKDLFGENPLYFSTVDKAKAYAQIIYNNSFTKDGKLTWRGKRGSGIYGVKLQIKNVDIVIDPEAKKC